MWSNWIKSILTVSFIFLAASLQARIVETAMMQELYTFLDEEALVIFDVDNTLIEPEQELGSSQWLAHRIKDFEAQGHEGRAAIEKALPAWIAIQNLTGVQIVEEGTKGIIRDLQDRGLTVMGLTTRGLSLATCTSRQLRSVGIDLARTAPTDQEVFVLNPHGVLYREGILFTAITHKGDAFRKFLKAISLKPQAVIFINDIYSQLQQVEVVCEEMGISFTGLRYGYLDEKVKNYRKQIADVQLYYFGRILSDDAAERVLHHSQK